MSDEIIHMIDSYDILNKYSLPTSEPDSPICTCSADIRPYKSANPMWSLQKAIMLLFREALDKELTMSNWSIGLDNALHPFSSETDRIKRQALTASAINDVITVTRLFCHMYPSLVPQSHRTIISINDSLPSRTITSDSPLPIISPIPLIEPQTLFETSSSPTSLPNPHHTTTQQQQINKPLIYILADSHGKYLSKNLSVCRYDVQINAISGLRFVDNTTPHLCATTMIHTPESAALLSVTRGVIFLIGINSVRSTPSFNVIPQITNIVSILRHNYPNLASGDSITFINTFPTISSLLNNISSFNEQLISLSNDLQFSVLDLQVSHHTLSTDQLHLQPYHQRYIAILLSQYIDRLPFDIIEPPSIFVQTNSTSDTSIRPDPVASPPHESNSSSEDETSPVANPTRTTTSYKNRKNRRRHAKRHLRRLEHILSRPVSSSWTLSSLKQYLRSQHIRFAFLSPLRNSILRIAFDDPVDLTVTEQIITEDYFDESRFVNWSVQQQSQPEL